MKLIEAREKLAILNQPLLTLQDVIGVLQIDISHASKLMNRLTQSGSLIKIRRGLWAWPNSDPLSIPTYLTTPLPCYISLQSALFYHGIIEQVPSCYYAVTLGRKYRLNTAFGAFSIHRIDAHFFFGFDTHYHPFFQMATPEKALMDYFYLSRNEPKLFGRLPELDKTKIKLPKIKEIFVKITDLRMQTFLKKRLEIEGLIM